ncbi:MAG: cytidylate kinase-like family protein [Deltaproteobacteria bacterium]|nr:cytidylate kinase-like family protein [Deltaproteobacteria bacterium]
MAVITISRQFGAGGRTLGKMLADKLGYIFADNSIIRKIAREAKVSTDWVRMIEKEGGTKLSRIISGMVSQSWIERILSTSEDKGYIDEQLYLDYLVLFIAEIADEGNAVILGRGSQYILQNHPDTYNILLINKPENRIRFMVENYNVMDKKAASIIANEDKRRINLYSKLGKKDYDDPANYHIVFNMAHFTPESVIKIIIAILNA